MEELFCSSDSKLLKYSIPAKNGKSTNIPSSKSDFLTNGEISQKQIIKLKVNALYVRE